MARFISGTGTLPKRTGFGTGTLLIGIGNQNPYLK